MKTPEQGAVFAAVFLLLFAGLYFVLLPGRREALPPEFVVYVRGPKPSSDGSVTVGNWVWPAAVATINGRLFVLDSGNDRILELDGDGNVKGILCQTGDCQFLLKDAQAMTSFSGDLYIANTGSGQVVVLTPDGFVKSLFAVNAPGDSQGRRFSPSGIAVSPAGEIYVSDKSRDLVLRLSHGDQPAAVVLDTTGENEKYRASKPAGLATDAWGNLYVANSGSGHIRKYSPEGRHLQEFSMRSNPGYFSPAYLALDARGNVFFTDHRSRMVHVFDQGGALLGVIGLLDASRVDSPGVLRDPWGLYIDGDILYVADREAGLFGFRIDPDYWKNSRTTEDWVHR